MSRELPVNAPKPEEFHGTQIVIPDITGVEYYLVSTGQIIYPGTFPVKKKIRVGARAKSGYYLNNTTSVWSFGSHPYGLDISISLYRLEGGIFTITGDEVFDYIEVIANDRTLDENPAGLMPADILYEVILKDQPTYNPGIKFNTDEGVQDSFVRYGGMPTVYSKLEMSREGTLIAFNKLSTSNTNLSMNIELREIYPEKPYELDLSPEIRLLDRTSVVLNEKQFSSMFNLTFNGKKITGAKTLVEKTDRIRIHAKLLDPYFVWDDTHPVRSTSIQVGGTVHFFERQPDGSELLDIPWPRDYFEILDLVLLARGSQEVKHVEIRNPDPVRVQGTNRIYFHEHYPVEYVDLDTGEIYESGREITIDRDIRVGVRVNPAFDTGEVYTTHYRLMTSHITYNFAYIGTVNRVVAPKPVQNGPVVSIPKITGVIYYDTLQGEELTNKDYDLTLREHERMLITVIPAGPSYVIENIGVEWAFDNTKEVSSIKPTQDRNNITIPTVQGLRYVNTTAGGVVEGTITIDEKTTIEARPSPGYTLVSEVNSWTFDIETKIRAPKPEQRLNEVVIPDIEGAEYRLRTGEVISGTYTLTNNRTIYVRETIPGTLINPSDNWFFTYYKPVVATRPEFEANVLSIPYISGIQYYNDLTGEVLEGEVEVKSKITVKVRQSYTYVILENPLAEWTFEYEAISNEKKIHLPPWVYLQSMFVNGAPVERGEEYVLLEKKDTEQRIEITLSSDYQTRDTPYLETATGGKLRFRQSPTQSSVFFSNYRVRDLTPATIVIPNMNPKYRELSFIGRNTTLQFREVGGPTQYLKPGGKEVLKTNGHYIFTVVADPDYEFDRDGKIRHDGLTKTMLVDKGSNKTRATAEIFDVMNNVEVELVAVYLGPGIPDPEPSPDPGPLPDPEEPFEPVEPQPEDPDPDVPGDPNQPVYPGGPSEVLGFNNVYLVDKDILTRLSIDIFKNRRKYIIQGSEITGGWDPNVYINPHTYIINTLQLPFAIQRKDVGRRERIQIGFTDFRPTAITLIRDKIRLNLGTIKTNHKYNNAYDYKATDTILHLPYSAPITLDPNYVVGEELDIEYVVDVYTGETTINLRSTFSGANVFYSTQVLIGNVVPFITVKDATTIGSPKDSKSVRHNNVLTPYVEVIRNKQHNTDSQYTTDYTTVVDRLDEVSGRVYVHQTDIQLDTTVDELLQLKSILSSGIVIK